jgi:hypothetical protein
MWSLAAFGVLKQPPFVDESTTSSAFSAGLAKAWRALSIDN